MKHKQLQLSVLLLLAFGLTGLQAQESVNTSGGEAFGSGGSASYSVGLVVYTTNTGTNGSVAKGVQQPYEISVVTAIKKAEGINLSVSVYPNPTTDYLTLKVENYETAKLNYQIFDVNGKLLQSKKATGEQTQIETSNLVPASYFVKVLDNKKEIKVFKIIKSN
ncbi:MAG: T9SS type A sorting domain-containing protein [Bacteroidetes bacterium]|nr:T9SS type A sorting domain-containing protein [Bacteroidota bacterium]